MKTRNGALLVAVAFAFGCGGGETAEQAATETPQAAMTEAPAAAMEAPSGPIDVALAAQGEQLFTSRGCAGCHQIDAKLIGPALKGVTTLRSYEWFTHMVLRPDSMIANDPDAKALFAEYGTPMVNMGATADEVRALFEYLRQHAE
jgi:mono/diheme cytochrome c family protein